MRKWTRWQDWVAVAAGLFAAVSTSWLTPAGASMPLMIILGILLIVAGLWNLAVPHLTSMEGIQALIGALLFISPWVGAYAGQAGVAWASWVCGGVGVVVGLWALAPVMREHQVPHATH